MPVNKMRKLTGHDVQLAARVPLSRRPNIGALRDTRDRFKAPAIGTLVDAVFEGGGALGTAYVGSLRAMEDQGVWVRRVAGNSAGAITAAMVAAGYTAREIQWLTSNFPERGPRPPTLPNAVAAPIDFRKFLDLPRRGSDFPVSTRRATLLWRLLKGQIVDRFLTLALPIPTRASIADKLAEAIVALPLVPAVAKDSVADVVQQTLVFLPASQPSLGDFVPPALRTEALRTTFADALWNVIADSDPAYRLTVNLVCEGGVFDGDVLLETMSHLLDAKLGATGGTVKMRDLPMPLGLIAADTDTYQMVILSALTQPDLAVAEAVRRSMSIPFVFQPRLAGDHEIMDGGLCANYPFWLFSPAGHEFMPPADRATDGQRTKIGFILDEHRAAPASWNAEPPVFTNRQGRPVDASPLDALARIAGLDIREVGDSHFEGELIERLFRVLDTMDRKEEFLRNVSAGTLMAGSPYHEVHIPVKGFHWLDFTLNSDEDIFSSIADRGWQATIDTLKAARLIEPTTGPRSPYRP